MKLIQKINIENGLESLEKIGDDDLVVGLADVRGEFHQETPSDVWDWEHNKGKRISVQSFDFNNKIIIGVVKHINDNRVQVHFKYSITGYLTGN